MFYLSKIKSDIIKVFQILWYLAMVSFMCCNSLTHSFSFSFWNFSISALSTLIFICKSYLLYSLNNFPPFYAIGIKIAFYTNWKNITPIRRTKRQHQEREREIMVKSESKERKDASVHSILEELPRTAKKDLWEVWHTSILQTNQRAQTNVSEAKRASKQEECGMQKQPKERKVGG